jgi:hypothetical protein
MSAASDSDAEPVSIILATGRHAGQADAQDGQDVD